MCYAILSLLTNDVFGLVNKEKIKSFTYLKRFLQNQIRALTYHI